MLKRIAASLNGGTEMSKEHSLQMLAAGQAPERYLRNIGTVGIDGQIKLIL